MIKKNYFLFLVIPVHANQLDSGVLFILPYSVAIPPRSGKQMYFGTILVYSVSFPCHSVLFQSHFALFRLFQFIPVYSALFMWHSGSFLYTPVPFLFIPSHSGIFRFIPVYSVPFRSVPVFSNAPFFHIDGHFISYMPSWDRRSRMTLYRTPYR